LHRPAGGLDGPGHDPLQLLLVGPGRHVRTLPRITAGDEEDRPLGGGSGLAGLGQRIGALASSGHGVIPSWCTGAWEAGVTSLSGGQRWAGPAGLCGPAPEPRWISIASKLGASGRVVAGRSR